MDALKVETSKIKNLNELIKLFYNYWKQFNKLSSSGRYTKEQVFRKGIKDADIAIKALASINLNQEIGDEAIMKEKTHEIENELAVAQSLTEDTFKEH